MRRVFLATLLVLFIAPLSALAAPGCFSKAEAEADQGIRIHSELMVIGLNCNHMGKRQGQNLYATYRQFTADHASLFSKYESIIMESFKKNGSKNAVSDLNDLRTRYANKISNDAAKMRPDIFCAKYAPRVLQAKSMTQEDVRKWAASSFPDHPVSKPLCSGG